MIRLENITKEFPDKVLFKNVNLTIKPRMRIGLVGANGTGKTTLLRILLKKEMVDSGQVIKDKQLTVGYLPQDITVGSQKSILEEILSVYPEAADLEREMEIISAKINEDLENKTLLIQLGQAQEKFEKLGGWELEKEAKKVLSGLGFQDSQMHDSLEVFSGGWRMRVALAGLLLQSPDYLFLDEPTNHLDLEATIWLESFLNKWKGGLVLISHDRSFLDASINNILELERGQATLYTGNFSQYQIEKSVRRDQQKSAFKNQQKMIAETERFIERFRYKNTKSRQVQSRIKQLDKLERIEDPEDNLRALHLSIPQPDRGPLIVASLNKVVKQYGDLEVYSSLSLDIERSQKIGLVGPNGAGKSTLLKILAGVESINSGDIKYGPGVKVAYFAQHQLEVLNPKDTVYETIEKAAPAWTISEIRTFLGGFLFSGDTVDKLVTVLSGGEKSRLALARLLVEPAHLLLLDEPTNHLDMAARDVIETALTAFKGTIVCISHDRHFMNQVNNLIINVQDGILKPYHGNYDYFQWKSKNLNSEALSETKVKEPRTQKVNTFKERKRLNNQMRKIEKSLERLDMEMKTNQSKLENPEILSNYEIIQNLLNQQANLEKEYLERLEEQEQFQSQLDKFQL